jgi:hypothetical protein
VLSLISRARDLFRLKEYLREPAAMSIGLSLASTTPPSSGAVKLAKTREFMT